MLGTQSSIDSVDIYVFKTTDILYLSSTSIILGWVQTPRTYPVMGRNKLNFYKVLSEDCHTEGLEVE